MCHTCVLYLYTVLSVCLIFAFWRRYVGAIVTAMRPPMLPVHEFANLSLTSIVTIDAVLSDRFGLDAHPSEPRVPVLPEWSQRFRRPVTDPAGRPRRRQAGRNRGDCRRPTTVTRSRCPRAFALKTQKPFSGLWKVTRSTRPARTSCVDDSDVGFIRAPGSPVLSSSATQRMPPRARRLSSSIHQFTSSDVLSITYIPWNRSTRRR